MKWINQYDKGLSIEKIMKISINDMINNEEEIFDYLNKHLILIFLLVT